MKKRMIAMLMAASMTAASIGTVQLAYAEEAESKEIAFVCPICAGDTNWNNALAGMEKACEEVGYTVNLVGPAQLDLEQWVKDMDSAIASGYDMIITTAVVDIILSGVERAIDAGIPVALIDTDSPDCGRFTYVGLDNYSLGCALADQVAEMAGDAETKVCLMGMEMTGNNFQDRINGFKDTCGDKYPNIEVVTEQTAGDAATATDVTGQVINGFPEINCFVGLDGTVPKGIAQTLAERGEGDNYIATALSIDQQVLDYIKDGSLDGGIGLDYVTMGYQAVLNCYAYNNGEEFTETIIPDTIPVTQDNAQEFAESVGLE